MKFILVALLFVSAIAQAQTAPAKAKPKSARKPAQVATPAPIAAGVTQEKMQEVKTQQWYTNRIAVGGIYSTAATFTGLSGKVGTQSFNPGDMTTSESFGVLAQARYGFDKNIDATFGLQVQQRRQLQGFSQIRDSLIEDKPEFLPVIAELGISVRPNSFIYLPVGINTTIYNDFTSGSWDSMTMTPALGFQAGVGGKIQRNFAAELLYQSIAYDFDAKGFGNVRIQGTAKLEGFALVGKYLF